MKRLLPAAVQVAGGVAAMVGCYLLTGLAVTLVIGGAVVVVLGMLKESGRV